MRNRTQMAEVCKIAAQKLGTTTPAGTRLGNTSQFLLHVVDDMVRSAQHWHKIYPIHPRQTSETGD